METIELSGFDFSTAHFIGGLSIGLFCWLAGWAFGKGVSFVARIIS